MFASAAAAVHLLSLVLVILIILVVLLWLLLVVLLVLRGWLVTLQQAAAQQQGARVKGMLRQHLRCIPASTPVHRQGGCTAFVCSRDRLQCRMAFKEFLQAVQNLQHPPHQLQKEDQHIAPQCQLWHTSADSIVCCSQQSAPPRALPPHRIPPPLPHRLPRRPPLPRHHHHHPAHSTDNQAWCQHPTPGDEQLKARSTWNPPLQAVWLTELLVACCGDPSWCTDQTPPEQTNHSSRPEQHGKLSNCCWCGWLPTTTSVPTRPTIPRLGFAP